MSIEKTVLQTEPPSQPVLLGILEAIEEDSAISQRKLAERLDVALGLVNNYLRWCVHKGWVKIQNVPARRYAYFLTPQGFLEKSALIGSRVQETFAVMRVAREECLELISQFEKRNIKKVVLVGGGDLQEFAYMVGQESALEFSKVKSIADIDDFDALLLTDMNNSQATYNALAAKFPHERIFTMPLLKVSREAA